MGALYPAGWASPTVAQASRLWWVTVLTRQRWAVPTLRGTLASDGSNQARNSGDSQRRLDRAAASLWAEFHDRPEPGAPGRRVGGNPAWRSGHRSRARDRNAHGRIIGAG